MAHVRRHFLAFSPLPFTRRAKHYFPQKCQLLAVAVDCLLDCLHDGVDLGGAAQVDGPALLLAGLAADVGGHVVEDGGCGHIDDVGLAERGGNGKLVSLDKELVVFVLRNIVSIY